MNFKPHDYQAYAINYIEEHHVAAVLLGLGMGKTIISLTAISELMFDSFEISKALIIGPLRVARDSWPMEISKWEHLKHLTYAVAVGTLAERKAALAKNSDITIINRENVQWLVESGNFLLVGIIDHRSRCPDAGDTDDDTSRQEERTDNQHQFDFVFEIFYNHNCCDI